MGTPTRNNHLSQDPTHPESLTIPPDMGRAQFRAMGTTITLLLPEQSLHAGAETVHNLFAHWEKTLSRFKPESELSQLNQRAGQSVKVSDLLFRVIRASLHAAEMTEGLFDPTLLTQLVQLGYDRPFNKLATNAPPGDDTSRPGGDWRTVQLISRTKSVSLPPGCGIDVGGIAKGMAVDAALKLLSQYGIRMALINAGGDLAAIGIPPGYRSWPLAIDGPTASWVIPFRYGALATSGIARRHWRQGNIERHHLLDPRSGKPTQNTLWSVTVAAGTCEQAEVIAKAAFLLGPEEGAKLLTRHKLAGLFIHSDGNWTSAGPWPVESMREEQPKGSL
ncbi:FAD:protein FMN transferase [Ktedonospora formicarum]|uniref:FAD:protein FMN transferase n=1 Tax=Ktedonospora formicarum TaxID=2778364 RepID=A0A8J3MU63_9CHLR|nr:FAD:protein FMN transferase [Ktedonospora formicarum]GHO46303.1 FAD:protein FMN transferase [Ktedonospora formicarum]